MPSSTRKRKLCAIVREDNEHNEHSNRDQSNTNNAHNCRFGQRVYKAKWHCLLQEEQQLFIVHKGQIFGYPRAALVNWARPLPTLPGLIKILISVRFGPRVLKRLREFIPISALPILEASSSSSSSSYMDVQKLTTFGSHFRRLVELNTVQPQVNAYATNVGPLPGIEVNKEYHVHLVHTLSYLGVENVRAITDDITRNTTTTTQGIMNFAGELYVNCHVMLRIIAACQGEDMDVGAGVFRHWQCHTLDNENEVLECLRQHCQDC